MAEIVLGIGSSHGPMLSTPPERWHLRADGDRRNPRHPYRGRVYGFEELAAARAGEGLAAQLDPALCQERFDACQRALARLGDVFAAVRPDVAVIVGNDQMEMFWDGLLPSFTVYHGDTIPNRQPPPEVVARMDPAFHDSIPANAPAEPALYPGAPGLGLHILGSLLADGFDVNSLTKVPPHRAGWVSMPHAFGFIYNRIMRNAPPPSVPVIQNTFFPPNQPTVGRCLALGRALARAIRSWESDARVALVASGGLTHFVIDEAADRFILDAFRTGAVERLSELGEATFQSGTSEVKNWIPVAAAMAELGLDMTLVDYVPCYRSAAGTGNAMGFVHWQKAA